MNVVAEVISMFFLYTYGMVNLVAFVESFGANPSFRPRFRFYHWSVALYGALSCVAVTFCINWFASLIALAITAVLYYTSSRHALEIAFGDARRGFIFSWIRRHFVQLRGMPSDPKNWRPSLLVLTSDPAKEDGSHGLRQPF